MNKYIKHIVEAFDFNTVNTNNKYQQLINRGISAAIQYNIDLLKDGKMPVIDLSKHISIYTVKNREELILIIKNCIKLFGNNCNLNWLDTSHITDMHGLFDDFCDFNGDISKWNTSNVTTMYHMFYESSFTGDISNWDVSKVTNMRYMFGFADFNV